MCIGELVEFEPQNSADVGPKPSINNNKLAPQPGFQKPGTDTLVVLGLFKGYIII